MTNPKTTIKNLHIKPFSKQVKKLYELLESDKDGLTTSQASSRLAQFGPNQLKQQDKICIGELIFRQFKDVLVAILFAAAVFSFIVGEKIDAIAILSILIVNSLLGFIQEYKAEKSLDDLKHIETLTSVVMRDGKRHNLPAKEIVPGDLLVLQEGDKVPADARLLEIHSLEVDESMLTGESLPVKKQLEVLPEQTALADRTNMVFSGSVVTKGRGQALVIRTGMKTEIGKIANDLIEAPDRATPLQLALDHLGKILAVVSIVVAIPGLVIGIIQGRDIIEMLMMAVSLAVSTIPEGLPIVVTIALAMGIKRMTKHHVLVRKLSTAESLGGVDVICTDKTGTLTLNQMTVKTVFSFKSGFYDIQLDESAKFRPRREYDQKFGYSGKDVSNEQQKQDLEQIAQKMMLCSDATAEVGDPTEQAFIFLGEGLGLDQDKLQKQHPRLDEIPFNSDDKFMMVKVKQDSVDQVFIKGATEAVLEKTSLSAEEQELVKKINTYLSKKGLRVLALAEKVADKESDLEKITNFDFLGLVAMYDPPRKEVPAAIHDCHRAGIRVVMITGDHKKTAEAIAENIGLDSMGAFTGQEIDDMDEAYFTKVVKEANIFARVSPRHKVQILTKLQELGHQVAMTGDGVNDAPAVKRADVGIGVGDGTDLTKGVADMILLNNNFAHIRLAIKEGRHIFSNIKKFIKFLVSTNFDEILEVLTSVALGLPLSLLPLHILWLNLITDSLPALSLSLDPEEPGLLDQKPYNPKKEIFNGVIQFAVVAGLIDYICTYGFFLFLLKFTELPLIEVRTMSFTASVLFEFFLVFAIRSDHPIKFKDLFNNKLLLLSVALGVAGQLMVIYVPFLQNVFSTTALSLSDWIDVLLVSFSGFLIIEVLKKLKFFELFKKKL